MSLDIGLPIGAGITFLISYYCVDAVRRLALRWHLLDVPTERSSHFRAIPTGGGLVLVSLNLLGWVTALGIGSRLYGYRPLSTLQLTVCVGGALAIAGVSLIDDLGHVPFPIRLGVHLAAAVAFVVLFTSWNVIVLPVVGTVALGGVGVVVSILWIVGLTNAYNFIDGLDGMAAGQAVVASIGWIALGLITHHPVLVGAGLLLTTTSLGFLLHNWHPARIFMGDVGSTFLGYSLAVLPLIAARYDTRLALAGVLLVWPVVFDTGFTVLRRMSHGENIFAGHREFLFHRLVSAGWSHRAASLFYAPLPLLGACLAFTWQYGNPALHAGVFVVLVTSCGCLWSFVCGVERKSERRASEVELLTSLDAPRRIGEAVPVPLTRTG